MSASSPPLSTPEGPGSVSGAPNLPAGFTDTFIRRFIDIGELRLHAVIGGEGPPLLLVRGWPQTWYAWRMLMPALAEDFQVVAVDQRGIGLSDRPRDGDDTATLAGDLVALMAALGHQRFAMYGTDTGMPIAYALAADHPERLERLVVSKAPLPGMSPSPPLLLLHRHARRRSRRPARELRDLPGVPHHHRAGRAAQGPAAALTPFLAPYRDGPVAAPDPTRATVDEPSSPGLDRDPRR